MLSKNEGIADRIIRVLIGSLIGYVGLTESFGLPLLFILIIAGALIITGLSGFCLLYSVFGINTCNQPDDTP